MSERMWRFIEGFADAFWTSLRLVVPVALVVSGFIVCVLWLVRWVA